MKKMLLLFLCVAMAGNSFGQTKDLNTAIMKFKNYVSYEKADGKTGDLEKARDAIDKCIKIVDEKIANNDAKLKGKVISKAYHWQGLIYTELATEGEESMKAAASGIAAEAITKSVKYDEKGTYSKVNVSNLDLLRTSVYNQGIKSFKEKAYDDAYSSFEKSMAYGESINKAQGESVIDTAAITMMAYAAQNGGNTDNAIKHYQQLVDLDYNEISIYNSLSNLYLSKGESDKAMSVLQTGKEKFPKDYSLLITEINMLLKSGGDPAEAQGKLEQAIEMDNENPSLFFALATNYDQQSSGMLKDSTASDADKEKAMATREKAITNYKKAIELNGEYYDALYNLGAIYYNQAADMTREMVNVPINEKERYKELEDGSQSLFKEALPYFEKALEVKPTDFNTLRALKEISANMGAIEKTNEYKERLEALEEAE